MVTNNVTNPTVLSEGDAASQKVRNTLFKYLIHWYLFVIFIFIALFTAYTYLKYTNPVFKATSTLLLVKDDKGGGDKDLIDALVSGKSKINVQDEIELIRSRYLLNKVVAKNNLNADMFIRGRIQTSELSAEVPFSIEGPYKNDTAKNEVFVLHSLGNGKFKVAGGNRVIGYYDSFVINSKVFKILPNPPLSPEANKDYTILLNNNQTAASKIAGNLKIVPKSTYSRVVEMNYSGTNTSKVQFVLQKVMEEYIQLGVDEKKKVQQNTLSFINERIAVLSGELGSVEGRLESFRKNNNVIDVPSQSQQFLGDVNLQQKDLSQLLIKRQMIQYLSNYLSDKTNLFNLTPTNLGIEDPVLLTLSQNYNAIILERERELVINTPLSPIIKNLEATIEKSRISLVENLRSLQSNNEQVIKRANAEKSQVQSQISQVPEKERMLGGIMRQEKIKNDLFSYLLQKREETEISLAGALTDAKILNTALVSPAPVSPNRRTVWLVALMTGIAIPLLIIWIRDLLNNKVNTRGDITQSVSAPLLGDIAHSNETQTIVVKPASRKHIGEQFRNIRSNINFMVPSKSSFSILVTSSNAGEGKSFVSINLGATYAVAGKKTIIIELDLRRPKLAQTLDIVSKTGVADYLAGNVPLAGLINAVEGHDNLYLLAAGAIPPNPSELLMGDKMKLLIADLQQQFEVVILDCPPVGLVSDALILSPFVDLALYIIRQRSTLKSQLSFINELHQSKKLTNMAIIANDVKVAGYNGYYGYGYGQGYGYGYGYAYSTNGKGNGDGYFEAENPKKKWWKKLV